MELQINDKVIINMPMHDVKLKNSSEMRKYNRKVATITAVNKNGYSLSVDDGKYNWPASILGKVVR